MKSGSELFANRSVLVSAWSVKEQFWKASPKGGSIPLMLGCKMKAREAYNDIYFKIPQQVPKFEWQGPYQRHCRAQIFSSLTETFLPPPPSQSPYLFVNLWRKFDLKHKKEKVLVLNIEDFSMAELSSSLDCCLWKENRTGERLASTGVIITHTICKNIGVHSAWAVW